MYVEVKQLNKKKLLVRYFVVGLWTQTWWYFSQWTSNLWYAPITYKTNNTRNQHLHCYPAEIDYIRSKSYNLPYILFTLSCGATHKMMRLMCVLQNSSNIRCWVCVDMKEINLIYISLHMQFFLNKWFSICFFFHVER